MVEIAPALRPTSEDVPLALAVIIPCHNVEGTLAEQLDALTAQTWTKPWGVVVVDNNSTDGTAQLAQQYGDRGVRIVAANDGKGVAYARNAGFQAVTADAVAFCDGDDVVHEGWVAAMGDALQGAPVVSGRIETHSINPDWLADTRPLARPGSLATFGKIGFASGCTCGIRADVFGELGGFDESFNGLEDIEFSLRALATGHQIHLVEDAVVAYRLRDDLRSVWRQGFFYGRGRPELIRRATQLGLSGPTRSASLKSWVWLVVHLPGLLTKAGRFRWVWVLANRVGSFVGGTDRRHPSNWSSRTTTTPGRDKTHGDQP